MKKCRTVNGLINAIKKGEQAVLKVYNISINYHAANNKGAYLNLGEGKYAGVGEINWNLIKNHLIDFEGNYCNRLPKYKLFYN